MDSFDYYAMLYDEYPFLSRLLRCHGLPVMSRIWLMILPHTPPHGQCCPMDFLPLCVLVLPFCDTDTSNKFLYNYTCLYQYNILPWLCLAL